jgi:hypothetical protein
MTIISLISNGIGGCSRLVFDETRLTADYNALGFYGKHFTLATCKPFYMLPNITASAYTGFTVHESLSLMPIFSACWHGRANPRVHSVCPPYIYLPRKSYIGQNERTYAISGRSKYVWYGLGSVLLLGFPVRLDIPPMYALIQPHCRSRYSVLRIIVMYVASRLKWHRYVLIDRVSQVYMPNVRLRSQVLTIWC